MTMRDIAVNLEQVHEVLAAACARRNRDVSDVTVVAVSKTRPAAAILAAVDAGMRHFGENRVEESESKIAQVNAQIAEPVVWHMIGHIQSRKARQIPALFDFVQPLHSSDQFMSGIIAL